MECQDAKVGVSHSPLGTGAAEKAGVARKDGRELEAEFPPSVGRGWDLARTSGWAVDGWASQDMAAVVYERFAPEGPDEVMMQMSLEAWQNPGERGASAVSCRRTQDQGNIRGGTSEGVCCLRKDAGVADGSDGPDGSYDRMIVSGSWELKAGKRPCPKREHKKSCQGRMRTLNQERKGPAGLQGSNCIHGCRDKCFPRILPTETGRV